MTIYYKVPRKSETGRKFEALFAKCEEVKKKIRSLGERYGFTDTWHNGWDAAGCYAVYFPEDVNVDTKLWRDGGCGFRSFAPRLSSKAGKLLKVELSACGNVGRDEFNEVMGVKGIFHNIGVATAGDFYAIALDARQTDEIPSDVIEIIGSEYNELCKDEEV